MINTITSQLISRGVDKSGTPDPPGRPPILLLLDLLLVLAKVSCSSDNIGMIPPPIFVTRYLANSPMYFVVTLYPLLYSSFSLDLFCCSTLYSRIGAMERIGNVCGLCAPIGYILEGFANAGAMNTTNAIMVIYMFFTAMV